MKGVVFYDFDFIRLGEWARCLSVNITKNYCGFGTAELHFSLADGEIIDLLENNPYVFLTVNENTVIVTGWQIGTDIAVFGRTPEWLLTKRVLSPVEKTVSAPEKVVCNSVSTAAGDFIEVRTPSKLSAENEYSTDKPRLLHDVVCEVLGAHGVGFEVIPDFALKKFVFYIFSGVERDTILSLSSRTAFDMVYTVEKQDAVSSAGWYERSFEDMGDWNAQVNNPTLKNKQAENFFRQYRIVSTRTRFNLPCEEGTYLYCDTPDGVWKNSVEKLTSGWVYYDESTQTGAKKWETLLNGTKTEAEALNEITALTPNETFVTEVKDVLFGEDYGIGDILRVQFEFGTFRKATLKRVKGVNIFWDINKSGATPVLESLEG